MANDKKVSLAEWIGDALVDPDKTGKCIQLTLAHMVGGPHSVQRDEIHSTKLNVSGKAYNAKELAHLFNTRSKTYAQDLPGTQTFLLMAFYEGSDEPQAKLPFTVEPKVNGESSLMTEPPTKEGQIQQGMRWTENILAQVYNRQARMDEHSLQIHREDRLTIANLAEENRELFSIFKEMMMKSVTDDREFQMKHAEYQRATQERKKLLDYIPPVVNTLTQREIFPQSTEDTALIEAIAEAVPTEKIQMMAAMGVIKAEMVGPLMDRFRRYEEKKQKEAALYEEAKKPLLNGKAEDDIEGNHTPDITVEQKH